MLMLSRLNTLFIATALICATPALHAQNMNLDLQPKQDKVLKNSTLWTIHATCQIHGNESKKMIKIKGNTDGGQVNGKELNVGQATSLTVYNDKTVTVTAEPGAQVTIINMSNDPVQAVCST
jgi:hypothetical protein